MEKIFSLNFTEKEQLSLDTYFKSKKILPIAKKDKRIREVDIKKLINSGHDLDAKVILDIVSPAGDFDVFISHYHENEDIALKIAATLRAQGFKPFVDSQYWLHFDDVANELNKLHLHKDKENGSDLYDHSKTKMIQKHCDVLLLSALFQVMSKCKYLIFISPPEKMLGIERYSKYETKNPKTYSPWIYWELIFVALLVKDRENLTESLKHSTFNSIPKISYPLSTKKMKTISMNDIINNKWHEK